MSSVLLIGHCGLGDAVAMIGCVYYLLKEYIKVYFMCTPNYVGNVERLFEGNGKVKVIPFPGPWFWLNQKEIDKLQKENGFDDVLNLCFQGHLGTLTCKTLSSYSEEVDVRLKVAYFANMDHIFKMYKRGGVDLNYYYKYFKINSTPLSLRLGGIAKSFKTMFVHLDSSRGEFYPKVIDAHLNDRNWLVISPNKNLYPKEHRLHLIAEMFVGFLVETT